VFKWGYCSKVELSVYVQIYVDVVSYLSEERGRSHGSEITAHVAHGTNMAVSPIDLRSVLKRTSCQLRLDVTGDGRRLDPLTVTRLVNE